MFFGKCMNCKKYISENDIENKKAFKLLDDSAVCERCYDMYFRRVRDFLYIKENRGSNIDEIYQATGVSKKLITLFYENGSLIAALEQMDEEAKQSAIVAANKQAEEEEKNKKIAIIQGLGNAAKAIESKPAFKEKKITSSFHTHDPNKKKKL